jgi:single-strand DNA-binding protein
LKTTHDGNLFCVFSLAVSENKKTTWFDCMAFRKTHELIMKYCRKGDRVYVDGNPEIREWEDKDRNKKKSFSIIVNSIEFLSSKEKTQETSPSQDQQTPKFDDNEELPF